METAFKSNLRLIRLLGRDLIPSDCEVTIHLTISKADADEHENSLKAIKFWLENFVDCSISYWPGTEVDVTMLEHLSNNVILTPEEPNDFHMCLLLHSKLNAIGRGHIIISKTEFTSDTSEGFTCSKSGDLEPGWLPTNDEWMGIPAVLNKPWWERSDASTIDIPYEAGDNILEIAKNLSIDLFELINDKKEQNLEKKSEQLAEIIKPSFKPRLIKEDE